MSDNNNTTIPEPGQLSYEEIIECIQEDKKVPNMINVPDIVHSSDNISQSTLPMRRKPWEIERETEKSDSNETLEQPNQQ
ncbi:hypothetical protein MOUN0_L09076 [Monosporozyma unispora]|nr:hypothetical protein C6P44_001441 [Kazachstania unispora]